MSLQVSHELVGRRAGPYLRRGIKVSITDSIGEKKE